MCNNSHCVNITSANLKYDTLISAVVYDCISNHNFIIDITFKNKEDFVEHFKGTGIYLIKEQIHTKSGLPSIANTIGPSAIQVVKSVYHLMKEQEFFIMTTR